jgi:hypothetical protein
MANQTDQFFQYFQSRDFASAQEQLNTLSKHDKQAVLAELHQKSGYQQQPFMVSVLRRELKEGQTFSDFYEAWEPPQPLTNPVSRHGEQFRQFFPAPVRVMNGTNINNDKEIISVGITWIKDQEQEQVLWDYLDAAMAGKDEGNNIRHEQIQEVVDGGLIGLYRVETDDNLGTPFE